MKMLNFQYSKIWRPYNGCEGLKLFPIFTLFANRILRRSFSFVLRPAREFSQELFSKFLQFYQPSDNLVAVGCCQRAGIAVNTQRLRSKHFIHAEHLLRFCVDVHRARILNVLEKIDKFVQLFRPIDVHLQCTK